MELIHRLESHWLGLIASAGGTARLTRFLGGAVVTNTQLAAPFLTGATLPWPPPSIQALPTWLEVGAQLMAAAGRVPLCYVPHPSDQLGSDLSPFGWRRMHQQVVLTKFLPHRAGGVPTDISVRAITMDEWHDWGDLLLEAYELSRAEGLEIQQGWLSLLALDGPGTLSQGYLASLLYLQGGIAGLYCGAVLPKDRRRGVERATLLYRLAEAAHHGATLCYLQTESDSPVRHLCVRHLGFQESYLREVWVL
jgi:hypothetical protein